MTTGGIFRPSRSDAAGDPVVPLNDLRPQHAEIADEVERGWREVCRCGTFVLGEQVGRLEEELAAYFGRRHCVTVGSGADALELGLRACGLRPGDEVAVPANSYAASAFAVLRAGGRVRFVDVDLATGLADGARLRRAAEAGARFLMPVHLYGQLCPLEAPVGAEAVVVEDAAQAHGARRSGRMAGSFGKVAALSFHASKNLGAYGDGGAVLTDVDAVAATIRTLRNHGEERKYVHTEVAGNSRLDELQAVVLRAKLKRLDRWNELRRAAAARYDGLLAGLDDVVRPASLAQNEDVWHLYVVRVPRRDQVLACLHQRGVLAGVHYPLPIHAQRPFVDEDDLPRLPAAERRAGEILSLPLFPHLEEAQQERVVAELAGVLRSTARQTASGAAATTAGPRDLTVQPSGLRLGASLVRGSGRVVAEAVQASRAAAHRLVSGATDEPGRPGERAVTRGTAPRSDDAPTTAPSGAAGRWR
jgi:dTDP-4-amino-4,6-dideoxygalactose transaminase